MDTKTCVDVPFFIEPFIGWRAWRLIRSRDGGLRLTSPAGSEIWPPREPMRARCRAGAFHAGVLPDADCSCGIYAASVHSERLVSNYALQAPVVGTVSMWGRIIEHERGARSEFAYPSRIAIVCDYCASEHHRLVAAALISEIDGFIARCSEHMTYGVLAQLVVPELLSTYGVEPLPLNSVPLVRPVPGPVPPVLRRPTAPRSSPKPDPAPPASPAREWVPRQQPKSGLALAVETVLMIPAMLAIVVVGALLLSIVMGVIIGIGYDVVHAVTPHHAPSPPAASASPSLGAVVPIGPPNLTFGHPAMTPRHAVHSQALIVDPTGAA